MVTGKGMVVSTEKFKNIQVKIMTLAESDPDWAPLDLLHNTSK